MNVKIGRTVDVQKQTLEIFFGRCLNEAADLELDEHAEAGVTLVEELLTDFLQVSNHRSRWHSQLSEDVSRVCVQLSLSPIPTGGQFLFTKEHF